MRGEIQGKHQYTQISYKHRKLGQECNLHGTYAKIVQISEICILYLWQARRKEKCKAMFKVFGFSISQLEVVAYANMYLFFSKAMMKACSKVKGETKAEQVFYIEPLTRFRSQVFLRYISGENFGMSCKITCMG